VKINSVMIPGINDEHLKEVSRVVRAKGAFLHNIMPLIAEAKHGTFFGLSGQPSPTPEELSNLQTSCESDDMRMMRHCRQCRADAVGLLGEDRGDEFSLEKIEHLEIDHAAAMQRRVAEKARIEAEIAAKHAQSAQPLDNTVQLISLDKLRTKKKTYRSVLMAVASKGQGIINLHFGHAQEFLIYEASQAGIKFIRAAKAELYCTGDETCGEAESRIERIIKSLAGCEVVLCAKIGYEPWGKLEAAGIQPNGEHAMEAIEDAVKSVYQEMSASGKLDEIPVKKQTMRA
jgi:nitrogen fixation protein NifB